MLFYSGYVSFILIRVFVQTSAKKNTHLRKMSSPWSMFHSKNPYSSLSDDLVTQQFSHCQQSPSNFSVVRVWLVVSKFALYVFSLLFLWNFWNGCFVYLRNWRKPPILQEQVCSANFVLFSICYSIFNYLLEVSVL